MKEEGVHSGNAQGTVAKKRKLRLAYLPVNGLLPDEEIQSVSNGYGRYDWTYRYFLHTSLHAVFIVNALPSYLYPVPSAAPQPALQLFSLFLTLDRFQDRPAFSPKS